MGEMIFTLSNMFPRAYSITLEAAPQLPIRYAPVIFELLPLGGVRIMVDDLVAEGGAQHLRAAHQLSRLAERLGHLAQLPAPIGVARIGLLELHVLLDAGQTRGDERGEGQIGI